MKLSSLFEVQYLVCIKELMQDPNTSWARTPLSIVLTSTSRAWARVHSRTCIGNRIRKASSCDQLGGIESPLWTQDKASATSEFIGGLWLPSVTAVLIPGLQRDLWLEIIAFVVSRSALDHNIPWLRAWNVGNHSAGPTLYRDNFSIWSSSVAVC